MAKPKPNTGESPENFMDRCMSDSMMMEEIPDHDRRVDACMMQSGKSADGAVQHKSFTGIELKKDKPGKFTARFATLNVIDRDGDVTLAGAVPDGKSVLISSYMHGSWSGAIPVGKGVIREVGEDVLVEGEFNLNTDSGKEHYEMIKFAPELQEWSYGFIVLELDKESVWKDNPRVWRVFKRLDVLEVSPVLRGAGVNTGVLSIKSEGQPFNSQAEAALAAVKDLVSRAKALAALRRGEGRDLSDTSQGKLAELEREMSAASAGIKVLLEKKATEDEGTKALIEAIKILSLTEVNR